MRRHLTTFGTNMSSPCSPQQRATKLLRVRAVQTGCQCEPVCPLDILRILSGAGDGQIYASRFQNIELLGATWEINTATGFSELEDAGIFSPSQCLVNSSSFAQAMVVVVVVPSSCRTYVTRECS
eukprot:TRINITY_DN60272_c0_g1_i1.p2 TRINITY_DN60272_c0_g1~~TRINITY_DN60272_c0_g1_i1.p2  ORF type:complete len:125 (+),score=8.81 TRINITY_DN60272_c0_g1_i1:331-705(+)